MLGIDTGSAQSAYAILEVPADRPAASSWYAQFVDCGMIPSTKAALAGLMQCSHDRLAIEQHGLVFRIEGASYMVQSSEIVGIAYGVSRLQEQYIQRVKAVDWRTELGLGRSPSNKKVANVIAGNVRGWPTRSNEHTRDAAGVALCALFRVRTKRAA